MFPDSQWDGVPGIREIRPQRPGSQELHVSFGIDLFSCIIERAGGVCGCRIDTHFLIKITDFGLSEDVFVRNYFRQDTTKDTVKLPVKWMAPESLSDGHFSEKSDVVSELVHDNWVACSECVFFLAVVLWCGDVGGVQWRQGPIPWH